MHLMTLWNGTIFRFTGPLCGEFTGHRWIPCTKASYAELWCSLWSAPWINGWVNNRETGGLRRHRAHHDAIVMATIYPIIYVRSFVVFSFVVVIVSVLWLVYVIIFPYSSGFIHMHLEQLQCPSVSDVTRMCFCKIDHYLIKTKHNKTQTVCIIADVYCWWQNIYGM